MVDYKNLNLVQEFLITTVNEPSVGMCHVQNHIKLSTPNDLQLGEKLQKNYEVLVISIPDIENTISQVKVIKKLENHFVANMKKYLDTLNFELERLKK